MFAIIVGAIDLLLVALRLFVAPWLAWKRNATWRAPISRLFSDEGVYTTTILSNVGAKWPMYSDSFETSKFHFLKSAGSAYTFVPKRSFKSIDDESAFRSMIKRHTKARLNDAAFDASK